MLVFGGLGIDYTQLADQSTSVLTSNMNAVTLLATYCVVDSSLAVWDVAK